MRPMRRHLVQGGIFVDPDGSKKREIPAPAGRFFINCICRGKTRLIHSGSILIRIFLQGFQHFLPVVHHLIADNTGTGYLSFINLNQWQEPLIEALHMLSVYDNLITHD